MHVILFGYRGSGKSTVGRLLGERLGLRCVDTDEVVRGRFGGMSIAEIWKRHGEPAFRAAECAVTAELLSGGDAVIALGGGTVMQAAARSAVESAEGATRVYLRGAPQTLHDRIYADAASRADRPDLTKLGGGVEEIAAVLAERAPVYEAVADHIIDIDTLSPDEVADRIAALLG